MTERLKFWVRATRARFLTAMVFPILLGTLIARNDGYYSGWVLLLSMAAGLSLVCGANLFNDYYDYLSGADPINNYRTPFNGGSGFLVDGVVSPKVFKRAGLVFLALGSIIGVFLVYLKGILLLFVGLAGVAMAYWYTAPPLRLSYRGFGELLIALTCGPFPTLGSYVAQSGEFSIRPVMASLPLMFLIVAVLWINEIVDISPDREARKYTLVVKLGKGGSLTGYLALLAFSYLSLAYVTGIGLLPMGALIGFLTLPIAFKAARSALVSSFEKARLLSSSALTIALHSAMGVLLVTALAIRFG